MSRVVSEATVTAPDSLALVQETMRQSREIHGKGGFILSVDFTIAGRTRRRYADGRVTFPSKRLTIVDPSGKLAGPRQVQARETEG